MFMGLRLAFGKKMWWPKSWLKKEVPSETLNKIIDSSLNGVKKMQRWILVIVGYIQNIYLRFIKFAIVGFSGTIVDFGVFFLLSESFKNTASNLVLTYIFPIIAYELSVIS